MGKSTTSMGHLYHRYVFFPAEWYDHRDHGVALRTSESCAKNCSVSMEWTACGEFLGAGDGQSHIGIHTENWGTRWNGTFDGDNMMIIYWNWMFIYFQTNAHRETLWKTQTGKPNRLSPLLSTSAKRRLDKSTLKIHCSHPFPFTKIHAWYVFINIWVTSVGNSGQRYVITVILYIYIMYHYINQL